MNTIRVILSIAVLAAIFGCSNETATESLENRNMDIVRQAHADLAARDFAAFKAAVAPGGIHYCQWFVWPVLAATQPFDGLVIGCITN